MVVLKALRTIINSLLVLKHSHTLTLNYIGTKAGFSELLEKTSFLAFLRKKNISYGILLTENKNIS